MNRFGRRRFLVDLTCVGGGLLAAVGLAWVARPEIMPVAAATPTPTPAPSPQRPLLKGDVAPPRPAPSVEKGPPK